ncbi:unnamed protein product [Moneuplotes crassus]|uniref:Uncharacterized protein n=1 Tax=Euplotes crassus TaxID=5936 RepID=A0AAD1U3I5_EUPCR|nr:unnamed protein product [Moneuplotes crassus]
MLSLPNHYFTSDFFEEDSDNKVNPFGASTLQSTNFESIISLSENNWLSKSSTLRQPAKDPKESQLQDELYLTKTGHTTSKKGRKPLIYGLAKRNDVVLKSVIRAVKGFHWACFKKTTSFTTKRKSSCEQRRECIHKYIEQEFGVEPNPQFLATLEAVLFMKKSVDEVNNIFRDLFYSFSQPKLERCMRDPYFKCLVYHFSFEANLDKLDQDSRVGIQVILNL